MVIFVLYKKVMVRQKFSAMNDFFEKSIDFFSLFFIKLLTKIKNSVILYK